MWTVALTERVRFNCTTLMTSTANIKKGGLSLSVSNLTSEMSAIDFYVLNLTGNTFCQNDNR